MAARATWKGLLKISLVTMPIKVYPATESSDGLSFNQLHDECQTRLQQKRWCPHCDREVPAAEIVKGFEFEKGKYVILLPEELDAVQPPSTKVIDLVQFADADELDHAHIDRTYFLAPDGPLAATAFAVVSAALVGKVGIGRLAIYGREYLVAVRVPPNQESALLLHTLHHAAEMRELERENVPIGAAVPLDQVRLARRVILALEGPLRLDAFLDRYQADLGLLIKAKIAGQEIVIPPAVSPAPAAVSLKDALTQSLVAMKKWDARVDGGAPKPRRRAS
jgi:DNA end-binding protein Ku